MIQIVTNTCFATLCIFRYTFYRNERCYTISSFCKDGLNHSLFNLINMTNFVIDIVQLNHAILTTTILFGNEKIICKLEDEIEKMENEIKKITPLSQSQEQYQGLFGGLIMLTKSFYRGFIGAVNNIGSESYEKSIRDPNYFLRILLPGKIFSIFFNFGISMLETSVDNAWQKYLHTIFASIGLFSKLDYVRRIYGKIPNKHASVLSLVIFVIISNILKHYMNEIEMAYGKEIVDCLCHISMLSELIAFLLPNCNEIPSEIFSQQDGIAEEFPRVISSFLNIAANNFNNIAVKLFNIMTYILSIPYKIQDKDGTIEAREKQPIFPIIMIIPPLFAIAKRYGNQTTSLISAIKINLTMGR